MVSRSSSFRRRRQARRARAAAVENESPLLLHRGPGLAAPDLLHAVERRWGDTSRAADLVRFAFEGGDIAGALTTLARATPETPTSFDREHVSEQLFLNDLLASAFGIAIDGKTHAPDRALLGRILTQAPKDRADTAFRQAILRELTDDPVLRRDLERVYKATLGLRARFDEVEFDPSSGIRRKLEILVATKQCIDALADGFASANAGLGRLREAGQRIRGGDGYARLAELVDLEGHLANVDVRLRLGWDGRVRGFGVLSIRENRGNALVRSPLLRFFERLAAFFRGYRYDETEVLVRLVDSVFAPLVDDLVVVLAIVGSIEFYLASLGFRDLAVEKNLEVSLAELVEPGPIESPGSDVVLEGVFNPLLWLQRIVPRPVDLPAPRNDAVVILTGPNSGGKTRLLQAAAMVQLLGQAGTFVPARRARIVRAPTLFASIAVEPNAAEVEGRLGSELLRVRRLFSELEPGSFVALDELAAGTNPLEGERIFEMVLSLLPRLRPRAFVSTHFLDLCARLAAAGKEPAFTFLQCELDADDRPTFAFVPGVATTSLAQKVAERLGVTKSELEDLVHARVRSLRSAAE
jgi:DNA mismatch repair protein MutS2